MNSKSQPATRRHNTVGQPAMPRTIGTDGPPAPDHALRRTIESHDTSGQFVASGSALLQARVMQSTGTRLLRSVTSTQRYTTKAGDRLKSDDRTDDKLERPRRILEWRHFEIALSEISPSSTEDGTLPELRKVRSSLRDRLTK